MLRPIRFPTLVRAELTKLRTVRRWMLALAGFVALTVGFGLLSTAGSRSDANEHPAFVVGPGGVAVFDDLYFVHGSLQGDATVVAHVTEQAASHPWARAGLMIKQGTDSGAPYVSIWASPGHGIRFDHDFKPSITAPSGGPDPWLRLDRRDATISTFTSPDGQTWRQAGTATIDDRGAPLEVGLFVSSPPNTKIRRSAAQTVESDEATVADATFDRVVVEPPTATRMDTWAGQAIQRAGAIHKVAPPATDSTVAAAGGTLERRGDVYHLTGSGAIGPAEPPDDGVQAALFGTVFGLMAVISVAVLFATSEYKHGVVNASFRATPRRRRVFAARAAALTGAVFLLALATGVVAYFVTRPSLRRSGLRPPAFALTSFWDPNTQRAVLGNALFVTALAVLGFALGTLWRRSAPAVAAVFALGVLPLFAAVVLPAAADWILRLTPAGGVAIQRAKPTTHLLAEPWSALNPWLAIIVTCTYACVAAAMAARQIERRDA
jgi:hypothetical protein